MNITVRATTSTAIGSYTHDYSGPSDGFVDWVLRHDTDANTEKVVNDLFSYGVADCHFTRYRLLSMVKVDPDKAYDKNE